MSDDDDDIRALIVGYARTADAGDAEAFAALFLPDATLETVSADGVVASRYSDRDDIAAIPGKLAAAYEATEHRVGGGSVAVAGSGLDATAIATTACEAHHVRDGIDRVLTIRYEDGFARDGTGAWRFASRQVHVLAVDERPA